MGYGSITGKCGSCIRIKSRRFMLFTIHTTVIQAVVGIALVLLLNTHTHHSQHYHEGETVTTSLATTRSSLSTVQAFSSSTLLRSTHHQLPPRHRKYALFQQGAHHKKCSDCLESILRRNQNYQFTQRLIAIPIHPRSNQTVILAEVYISKEVVLAQILSIILSPAQSEHPQQQLPSPPKCRIQILSSSSSSSTLSYGNSVNATTTYMVVDIGQITTIWEDTDYYEVAMLLDSNKKLWNDTNNNIVLQQYVQSNMDHIEYVLDRLHQTRRSKPSHSGSSKIAIQELMKEVEACCPAQQQEQEYAAMMFQKIYKTGMNFQRIIDSLILLQYLKFSTTKKRDDPVTLELQCRNRMIAAYILANDAQLGGRLKRWPCIYVSTTSTETINSDKEIKGSDIAANAIYVINGGWLITDQAVRSGTEARKFVERTMSTAIDDTIRNDKNANMNNNGQLPPFTKNGISTPTLADERIFRRLECLAMGELMNTFNAASHTDLELDVREVLRTMNLPINPDGAKHALIQKGYWSKDITKQVNLAKMIQPWSKPILDAAKWYTKTYSPRRIDAIDDADTSSRIDLTELPCVCVDAAKATFRDDAIGVRLRSSTGRAVIPEVSKWEILIHITDVSDLYSIFPSSSADQHFRILRDAAARRGSSRYDLPFGPLHLLPPIILETLSFPTTTGDFNKATKCRCVTIWAYIDERNGQLVDYGIERTLIAAPIVLTFSEATSLLNRKGTVMSGSEMQSRNIQAAQAILMVADRNIKLWDDYERQHNLAAQKREVRLAARERLSLQTISRTRQSNQGHNNQEQRDDGVDGFRRTHGHRLVDAALNLYTNIAMQLLQKVRAPIPRSIGADYSTRGGRGGTAPLRRYIDGQIQRQLLALFCQYGAPMTMDECQQVSIVANQATNSINNIRAIRSNMKK